MYNCICKYEYIDTYLHIQLYFLYVENYFFIKPLLLVITVSLAIFLMIFG